MPGATEAFDVTVARKMRGPFSGRLQTVVEWAMGLVLIAVVFINVINATGRHIFSLSVTGTDELMVYLVILIVMAGAVMALLRRDHINVNLLPSYIGGRWRTVLFIFHDLIALAATLYTAQASWAFVQKISLLDTRSMSLGIPMTIPHTIVFLGFAGMALVAFVSLARGFGSLAGSKDRKKTGGLKS